MNHYSAGLAVVNDRCFTVTEKAECFHGTRIMSANGSVIEYFCSQSPPVIMLGQRFIARA